MCWENPRQATLAPCGHRALCVLISVTPKLFMASSNVKVCSRYACRLLWFTHLSCPYWASQIPMTCWHDERPISVNLAIFRRM